MKRITVLISAVFWQVSFVGAAELNTNSVRFKPLPNTTILTTNGYDSQIAIFVVDTKVGGLEPFVITKMVFTVDVAEATPTDVAYLGWEAGLWFQFTQAAGTSGIFRNPTNHSSGSARFTPDIPLVLDTNNAVAFTLHANHVQGFRTGDKIRTTLTEVMLTSATRSVTMFPNEVVTQPVQGKEARITRLRNSADNVTIEIHGEPHNLYWIERSTDLHNWEAATDVEWIPYDTGFHYFTLPRPSSSSFYRAVTF